MKPYIIRSGHTDVNTVVELKTKDGRIYYGEAVVHPEETRKSEYFGGQIAEMRALIKMWRDERHTSRVRLKAYNDLLGDIKNRKGYSTTHPFCKVLYRFIDKEVKKIKDYTISINEVSNMIQKMKSDRTVYIRQLDENIKKKSTLAKRTEMFKD